MMRISTPCAALALSALSIATVHAQAGAGDAAAAPSPATAPYVTAVGQTKPPSRAAGPIRDEHADTPMPRPRAGALINRGICVGCATEPEATGSVTTAPAQPQAWPDVELDELRASAPPRQQADLDTVALASAHREQAKSMEEKTNGLWRSWLVSVCDGCGDSKPAKAYKLEDWPNRDVPLTTGSAGQETQPGSTVRPEPARHATTRARGMLAADLSPENVGQIRRMPRE